MTSSTEIWFDKNSAATDLQKALRSQITWVVRLVGCYSSGKTDLVKYCVQKHNDKATSANGSSGPTSYKKLSLRAMKVIDPDSFISAPHDSQNWKSVGQDELVKRLVEFYVPPNHIGELLKLDSSTQEEDEKWLISYLRPLWTSKAEVWLLEGAGFDHRFFESVRQLCSRLKPPEADNRGPLVIFENWKRKLQRDLARPAITGPNLAKGSYTNPFTRSIPTNSDATGSSNGTENTDTSEADTRSLPRASILESDDESVDEDVTIRIGGEKDQSVISSFIKAWLREKGREELIMNANILSRVLRSFAGGHLGSLRLVLKAIHQSYRPTDEDTSLLATSTNEQLLNDMVAYYIAKLNDDGPEEVTAHVNLLMASVKTSEDILGDELQTKLREEDGLIIEEKEDKSKKRWIDLIGKYKGETPMTIDPVSATIVVASLPHLFEWFRPGVQSLTTKVADAFGNVLQQRIYKQFQTQAATIDPASPNAQAEYEAIASSIVSGSTPGDVKNMEQEIVHGAIKLVRDPKNFNEIDLQNIWLDYRRSNNTESFGMMAARMSYAQTRMAEEIVMEAIRAKKFSEFLRDVVLPKLTK